MPRANLSIFEPCFFTICLRTVTPRSFDGTLAGSHGLPALETIGNPKITRKLGPGRWQVMDKDKTGFVDREDPFIL